MDHHAWSGMVNLDDPALVRRVHADYVRAGADVLITNTFMSGIGPLERAGARERFAQANRNAVMAAREARERRRPPDRDRRQRVGDATGRTGSRGGRGGDEHRRLRDGYTRQIDVLAEEGVDLIALEMVDHPRYAEPAAEAVVGSGPSGVAGICVHADERDRGEGAAGSHRRAPPGGAARARRRLRRRVRDAHRHRRRGRRCCAWWPRAGMARSGPIRTTASGSGRAGSSGISRLSVG